MNEKIHTSILFAGMIALGIALYAAPESPSLTYVSSSSPAAVKLQPSQDPLDAMFTEEIKQLTEEENTAEQTSSKPSVGTTSDIQPNMKPIVKEIPTPKEEEAEKQEPRKRLPQQTLYGIAAERVVNLFCKLERDEVAIATGIIIHEDGYILTNAHVAEVENPEPCLIRRGSPAHNFAIAERVFLPPGFSSDTSTRENLSKDVAIWKITDVIDPKAATSFPSLVIAPSYQVRNGGPLSTFSYPAELLGSQTVVSASYLSFSETTVQSHDAYFIESIQGLGSQKGSSGGILLDPYTGEFAGLIFAINDEKTASISERMLFSLTPFAVNEAVRTATGKNLEDYLAGKP